MCLESLIKESWGQIQVTQQIFVKSQAPVAHFCNPSYSGGRGLQDQVSKSVRTNRSRDPIGGGGEALHKKRAGGVAQGLGLKFKPEYHKKKKKKFRGTYHTLNLYTQPNLTVFFTYCFFSFSHSCVVDKRKGNNIDWVNLPKLYHLNE
jgi:hypothetical protein